MVSGKVIAVELPERPNVMNVRRATQFLASLPAMPTLVRISLPRRSALTSPIGAVVRFISAPPIEIFRAANVARSALPFGIAFFIAEDEPTSMRRPSFYGHATTLARDKNTSVLRMLRSNWRMCFPPIAVAFVGAKSLAEAIHSAFLLHRGSRAILAFRLDCRSPRGITTSKTAILLAWMPGRCCELVSATGT